MNIEKQKHESYGLLSFCRASCGSPMNLFGSSIKHNNVITLNINTASLNRELHNDYFFADKHLIEVTMSYNQFAEAISSTNTSGIPVTITRKEGKNMEACPEENNRQKIDKEFDESMHKFGKDMEIFMNNMQTLFDSNKALTKKEKAALLSQIQMLSQTINSNVPFMKKQFTEAMDKTTLEAKCEIEGFWLNKIHSLGLNALQEQEQTSPISLTDTDSNPKSDA